MVIKVSHETAEPQEWLECCLADACSEINYGLTASASDDPVGPRFLRITDIVSGQLDWKAVPYVVADDDTIAKYRLYDGDIVIARTGASTGASFYVKDPPIAVFASYLVRLRAKPEFDPRFIGYYLKSQMFWDFMQGVLGDKSAQPNASASTMASAPFSAPKNLAEQRAIAHILGTLDDKIELNRRMNQTLEAMARTIFQDWFVDFGPVRAKLDGREPYLPSELWGLFPNKMIDSDLGEIPEGWDVEAVEEIATIAGGSTPSTKVTEYWEGGTNYWATPKDLSGLSTTVLLGTERKITDAGLGRISSGLLPKGAVLLSSRAPIGYLAINEVPVTVNQGFITLIPKEQVSNLFLLHWCSTFMDEIISHANGSTFLEISKSNFRRIPLALPPNPIMTAYQASVDSMHKKIVGNERESRTLTQQRNTLLPRLLSAALRVEDKSPSV